MAALLANIALGLNQRALSNRFAIVYVVISIVFLPPRKAFFVSSASASINSMTRADAPCCKANRCSRQTNAFTAHVPQRWYTRRLVGGNHILTLHSYFFVVIDVPIMAHRLSAVITVSAAKVCSAMAPRKDSMTPCTALSVAS